MDSFFHRAPVLWVQRDQVYLPLLMDEEIAAAGENRSQPDIEAVGLIRATASDIFIKALSLDSLVENYPWLEPEDYERCCQEVRAVAAAWGREVKPPVDRFLFTIIFAVLPYFVRRRPGRAQKRTGREALAKFLLRQLQIPEEYRQRAKESKECLEAGSRLAELDKIDLPLGPPPAGSIAGVDLQRWLRQAVKVRLLAAEKRRLQEYCRQSGRDDWVREKDVDELAVALYSEDAGGFEIGGFGFFRAGSDYYIYRRTGEFILKDYYGRRYLFPDCRVAVSRLNGFRPLVLEDYKHPFLFADGAHQEICLKGFEPPPEVSAANIIQSLEAGVHALLYGYDGRRRNGYHSLDRITAHVRTVDFDDLRLDD